MRTRLKTESYYLTQQSKEGSSLFVVVVDLLSLLCLLFFLPTRNVLQSCLPVMDVKVLVLFSFFLSILFRCCFNWFLILGHSEVSQGWCRIQKDFCFSIFSHTILLYDRFEGTTKKFDGHLVSWFFFISWSNHTVSGFFFDDEYKMLREKNSGPLR